MKEIEIQGSWWKSQDDFFDAIFNELGSPGWHARNIDALAESLSSGDTNDINPPIRFKIEGFTIMDEEVQDIVIQFKKMITTLKVQGVPIDIQVE